MKVGDLVKFHERVGIVVKLDDSHRQHTMSVLFSDGLRKRIWEGHLEVINESR